MVSPRSFLYGATGPLAVGLHHHLGWCLTIRPMQHSYPKRIVVKLDRTFEMYDQEGQNFSRFIEVLRICLSTMDGPLELFYSPKFWVYFPWVVGKPIVMIYHLYTPFSHMRAFHRFFYTT